MPRPLTLAQLQPAEAPRALAPAAPRWSDIEASPKYQALDGEGRQSVRESFWTEVVSPMVPTDQLEEALGHFERRTGGPLQAVRFGPPPSDAELERAERPARMSMTRSGRRMIGQQAERSIYTLRQAVRSNPMLEGFSDEQAAAVLGGGAPASLP